MTVLHRSVKKIEKHEDQYSENSTVNVKHTALMYHRTTALSLTVRAVAKPSH